MPHSNRKKRKKTLLKNLTFKEVAQLLKEYQGIIPNEKKTDLKEFIKTKLRYNHKTLSKQLKKSCGEEITPTNFLEWYINHPNDHNKKLHEREEQENIHFISQNEFSQKSSEEQVSIPNECLPKVFTYRTRTENLTHKQLDKLCDQLETFFKNSSSKLFKENFGICIKTFRKLIIRSTNTDNVESFAAEIRKYAKRYHLNLQQLTLKDLSKNPIDLPSINKQPSFPIKEDKTLDLEKELLYQSSPPVNQMAIQHIINDDFKQPEFCTTTHSENENNKMEYNNKTQTNLSKNNDDIINTESISTSSQEVSKEKPEILIPLFEVFDIELDPKYSCIEDESFICNMPFAFFAPPKRNESEKENQVDFSFDC